MGANVLSLSDFEEYDFEIIAMHTVLPDYKLAFLLNGALCTGFKKLVPDIDYVIENHSAQFSAFEYHDSKGLVDWHLLGNKFKIKPIEGNSLGLFHREASFATTCVYLQPELKEADYLIKIEGGLLNSKRKEILHKINKIEGVITAYAVNNKELKHKEYLIF